MHMLLTLVTGIVEGLLFGIGLGGSLGLLDTAPAAATTAPSYILLCLCCLLVVLVRLVSSNPKIQIYFGQDPTIPSLYYPQSDVRQVISSATNSAASSADLFTTNSSVAVKLINSAAAFTNSTATTFTNSTNSATSVVSSTDSANLSTYSLFFNVSAEKLRAFSFHLFLLNRSQTSKIRPDRLKQNSFGLETTVASSSANPILSNSVGTRVRRQSLTDNRLLEYVNYSIPRIINKYKENRNNISVGLDKFEKNNYNFSLKTGDREVIDYISSESANEENRTTITTTGISSTYKTDPIPISPNGHSIDLRGSSNTLIIIVAIVGILSTICIVGCVLLHYNHHYLLDNNRRNNSSNSLSGSTASASTPGSRRCSPSMGIRTGTSPHLFSRGHLHHHTVCSPATVRNPNKKATVPMLAVEANIEREHCAHPDRQMLALEANFERERCAVRDRQVRLHSVNMDFELNLPPMIQLPDGEEMPYGSSTGYNIRDPEQERELYQRCVKGPPNRTIQESDILPYSARFLSSGGKSSPTPNSEWSHNVIRCHSMPSRYAASRLPPVFLPSETKRPISERISKITMLPCLSSSSSSSTDSKTTTTTTLSSTQI